MATVYTIFINDRLSIFCLSLASFLKKLMSSHFQALKNMLFWEVSAFLVLVLRLQSYGSFKLETFVWEITTKPHQLRFRVRFNFVRIQMPIPSRQIRI